MCVLFVLRQHFVLDWRLKWNQRLTLLWNWNSVQLLSVNLNHITPTMETCTHSHGWRNTWLFVKTNLTQWKFHTLYTHTLMNTHHTFALRLVQCSLWIAEPQTSHTLLKNPVWRSKDMKMISMMIVAVMVSYYQAFEVLPLHKLRCVFIWRRWSRISPEVLHI